MMKENYSQTDYIVKKNGVSYCVPPSLNTYGTNANLPNEIQLRVHKFQADNTLSLLNLGLDHGVLFLLKLQLFCGGCLSSKGASIINNGQGTKIARTRLEANKLLRSN